VFTQVTPSGAPDARPLSRAAYNRKESPVANLAAVTDADFEATVLKSDKPVLVDFWAEWCGPCKMIAPFLNDLAAEMAGRVTVAKVNIDENPQIPRKYGVRGIPTMILFKGGQVAATKIGALPKSKLYEWVESVL